MFVTRSFQLFGVLFLLIFIAGCGNDTSSNVATEYCQKEGGYIEQALNAAGVQEDVCVYEENAQLDIGTHTYTHRCEVNAFYENRCDEDAEGRPVFYRQNDSSALKASSLKSTDTNASVGDLFYEKVDEILSGLQNTGYAHNSNENFSLLPSLDQVTQPHCNYNLFLDCSGFVGYYVVQGLNKKLYNDVSRSYICGDPKSVRPLAADFANTFNDNNTPVIDSKEITASVELHEENICWGRVKSLEYARKGDILVYYHKDHIIDNNQCCYDNNGSWEVQTCSNATTDRRHYDLDGNSGHILFIIEEPKRAQNIKDKEGNLQWIVHIADSTTSKHSFDTRELGKGASSYYNNMYHAWSKGDSGHVQRCQDGSYHRDCSAHNSYKEEDIQINTNYENNPTGIGAGVMYVNDGLDGYRVKYNSSIEAAKVFIGRPMRCQINFKDKEYKMIISPDTNRTWLDRNLGATRACTSKTDTECFGDYYQWGRRSDGHEKLNSPFQKEQADSLEDAGGSYIGDRVDWTNADINGSQRIAMWQQTDGEGICPKGFRVPTIEELEAEIKDIEQDDTTFLLVDNLNVPLAGARSYTNDGAYKDVNKTGNLYSHTVDHVVYGSPVPSFISIATNDNNNDIYVLDDSSGKASLAYPVRCIKEYEGE